MESKTLENVLEEIKQAGNYAIEVHYGGGMGADDLDVPVYKRKITISAFPIGVLGLAKTLFIGTIDTMQQQDFKNCSYILVSNPPTKDEIENNGYYIWGTKNAIDLLRECLDIV